MKCEYCGLEINSNEITHKCDNCGKVYHEACWDLADHHCPQESDELSKTENVFDILDDVAPKLEIPSIKNNNKLRSIITFLGLAIIVAIIFINFRFTEHPILFTIVPVFIVLVIEGIFFKKLDGSKDDKLKTAYAEYERKYKNYIDRAKNNYELSKNKYAELCKKYSSFQSYGNYKIGIADNNFVIVELTPPTAPKYVELISELTYDIGKSCELTPILDLPLDDFIYFKQDGSVEYSTEISGGGVSIGGALIGGAIAGDVGAIIGSQKPISTKQVEHDSRKTIIKTKDNEFICDYDFYDVLMKVVPQKEFSYQLITNNKN